MPPTLTEEQDALLQKTQDAFSAADKMHQRWRDQWDYYDRLYYGYNDWRNNTPVDRRDRDTGLQAEKRGWGEDLVVRIIYSTIETLLPRMVQHNPRLLILPTDRTAVGNVQNMKGLVDQQQDRVNYALRLQTAYKDALKYGIGVQKLTWRKDSRVVPRIVPGAQNPWVVQEREVVDFDDPWPEAIDPYDFLWDPFADQLERADYVIHRRWLTTSQVMDRIKSGAWCSHPELTPALTAEDVESMGSPQRLDEQWAKRKETRGHDTSDVRSNSVHEVWECHYSRCHQYPRGYVVTVLDRQVPVQVGENPYWHGQLPFQVCRPTEDTHQMVGIPEPATLADYQEELSTLRGQRRDAASMALNAPIAYQEGLVDPADLKWEPNAAFPVQGPPRELIEQLNIRDVPGSSFQDEETILRDAWRTSGISDATAGVDQQGGTSETATGMQLLQAYADARVKLKARRCELELLKPAAWQWIRLNQQKILSRTMVEPAPVDPEQPAQQLWNTRQLTPAELDGSFAVGIPEGGASAPVNVQQDRADARDLNNLLGQNPHVNQRMLLAEVVRKLGHDNPDAWLNPPQPGIPAEALEIFRNMGGDADRLALAVQLAQQQADAMAQQDAGQAQGSQQPVEGNGVPA